MMLNIYLEYAVVVLFGLMIGSFLNVVILRFDDLKSIIKTRSHCVKCRKQIAWYDLFPFFSYLILRGRCRHCKEKISLQYPIIEAMTAIIFVLLFWQFGFSIEFAFLLVITSILIVVLTYDILKMMIADFLIWSVIVLWLAYLAINYFLISHSLPLLLNSLYGAAALGGFLGLIVLISWEKWMGVGDIKLGFLLGALVGWPNVLLATFLAFGLGSIISLGLIFAHQKTMKDMVPFAPFLVLGTYITIFWGNQIIAWYLGMLGY